MRFAVRTSVAVVGLLWLLTAALTSAQQATEDQPKARLMPEKTIEAVLEEHTPGLMKLPGVVGTAQGLCAGEPCIKVYVKRKTPDLLRRIPSAIEGHAVSVEETGEIRALDPS